MIFCVCPVCLLYACRSVVFIQRKEKDGPRAAAVFFCKHGRAKCRSGQVTPAFWILDVMLTVCGFIHRRRRNEQLVFKKRFANLKRVIRDLSIF